MLHQNFADTFSFKWYMPSQHFVQNDAAVDGEDLQAAASAVVAVLAMTEVLGINPNSPHWAKAASNDSLLDALIQSLIAERNAARAAKDFARSDAIRDQLTAAGITLEDGANATNWSVN